MYINSVHIKQSYYSIPTIENCVTRTTAEWIRLYLELCLMCVIVIGNGLVIISIIRVKVLHQVKNYFILSLALADLLIGLVALPLKLTLTEACVAQAEIICYSWSAVASLCTVASLIGLCVISCDRYIAVTYPLYYRVHVTRQKAYFAIAGTWMLSFILIIPYLTKATFVLSESFGTNTYLHCINHYRVWLIAYILVIFCILSFVTIFLSGKVWLVLIQRSQRQLKYPSANPMELEGSGNFSELIGGDSERDAQGCVMMRVVIGAFICSWLPYIVILFIDMLGKISGEPTLIEYWHIDLAIWLSYFNSSLNPFIYTMFSPDFRFAFKELICCRGGTINSKNRNSAYSKQVGSSSGNSSAVSSRTTSQQTQRSVCSFTS